MLLWFMTVLPYSTSKSLWNTFMMIGTVIRKLSPHHLGAPLPHRITSCSLRNVPQAILRRNWGKEAVGPTSKCTLDNLEASPVFAAGYPSRFGCKCILTATAGWVFLIWCSDLCWLLCPRSLHCKTSGWSHWFGGATVDHVIGQGVCCQFHFDKLMRNRCCQHLFGLPFWTPAPSQTNPSPWMSFSQEKTCIFCFSWQHDRWVHSPQTNFLGAPIWVPPV